MYFIPLHIYFKRLKHFFLFISLTGTGKTVVGVYIVYWFFNQNSKIQRKFDDPKNKTKQEVILYCGPSDKSVDVVAGKFLSRLNFPCGSR